MQSSEIWLRSDVQAQSHLMIQSFKHLLGRDLISSSGNATQDAAALFNAPFAVLSHGIESDPVLNYGNQIALDLWEINFVDFTRMPSRLTAEPMLRDERQRLMELAARKGFIDDYAGVRISASGKRFRISNVILWSLTNEDGTRLGQAAMFDIWEKI